MLRGCLNTSVSQQHIRRRPAVISNVLTNISQDVSHCHTVLPSRVLLWLLDFEISLLILSWSPLTTDNETMRAGESMQTFVNSPDFQSGLLCTLANLERSNEHCTSDWHSQLLFPLEKFRNVHFISHSVVVLTRQFRCDSPLTICTEVSDDGALGKTTTEAGWEDYILGLMNRKFQLCFADETVRVGGQWVQASNINQENHYRVSLSSLGHLTKTGRDRDNTGESESAHCSLSQVKVTANQWDNTEIKTITGHRTLFS